MFRHQEGAPMKTLCERCMTVCRFQGQKNFSIETCRYFHQRVQTVGDKFRDMSDEELAAVIVKAYSGGGDLSLLWCDRKGGCAGEDMDEGLVCTDERLRACVVRWLGSPAKEGT